MKRGVHQHAAGGTYVSDTRGKRALHEVEVESGVFGLMSANRSGGGIGAVI